MAPRREDVDGLMLIGEETTLSRSPTSFVSDRFIKSLSSMSLDLSEDSPPLDKETETAKASLITSLQLIAERGERLTDRVSNMITAAGEQDSFIVEACRLSLQSTFLYMLDEAQLLLDNMGEGSDSMITSWRVSLAQIRVDAYLESIETALGCCPDALNVELSDVSKNIATQLDETSVAIRISPWNLSSLGFDVAVATPVQHVLEAKLDGLPLNLQVRAIQEIQAKDMLDCKVHCYRAFKVYVKRCVHNVGRSFRAGAGSVGDVLVVIRVSPVEEETDDASVKSMQRWETEESRPVVKEARNVQVNAFPPSPKSTVDLYVSTNHGDNDTTITLRFPTYETLNDVIPDVRLELVMG